MATKLDWADKKAETVIFDWFKDTATRDSKLRWHIAKALRARDRRAVRIVEKVADQYRASEANLLVKQACADILAALKGGK